MKFIFFTRRYPRIKSIMDMNKINRYFNYPLINDTYADLMVSFYTYMCTHY